MKLLRCAKTFTRRSPAVPHANLSHIVGPAVLRFPGRERSTFFRHVPDRALASPPAGPSGAPDRWEHSPKRIRRFWSSESKLNTPPSSSKFHLINRWLAAAYPLSTFTTCHPFLCSVYWFYNIIIPISFHFLLFFFQFLLLLVYLWLRYPFGKVFDNFPWALIMLGVWASDRGWSSADLFFDLRKYHTELP